MKKISFIGLGTMGFPMAGHLADKGFNVTVFNRTVEVSKKWVRQYSGKVAKSLVEAVRNADVVITCLGDDDSVFHVYTESGVFDAMKKGVILIDHTTTSATMAEKLSAMISEKNGFFLDAPVSGGQVGAEQGLLTIMVGGDALAFEWITDILSCYANNVQRVGRSGDGQRCKMVNQLCVAGVLQGLSEGLELAKRSGFSAETILGALQQGAGSSWQMINRTQTMIDGEFDFGFAVDWMRKDLGICLEEARKYNLVLPLAEMVDGKYQALQERGYQKKDTSVLIRQFDQAKESSLVDDGCR